MVEIFWSSFFLPFFPTLFVVRLWELFCYCCLLLYPHFLMYCFLQIQPFAAQLLDNTQGAQGIPSVRVRPGRSGLEQNLSELVIHTTTVLQSINHVTICEPLRLLMDNPAALMVQFCFRFSFLFFLFLKDVSYRLPKCKIWIANKMKEIDVLLAVLR